MKTILPLLLAFTVSASAVTITINQNNAPELDFTIEWGQNIGEYGASAVNDETKIDWLAQISRNRNYYYVQISDEYYPSITGFGVRFWGDPEYYGAVPTMFGSPNITFTGTTLPQILPLENTPYGARFIYGVPDSGETAWLMALGLAGMFAVNLAFPKK